MSQHAGLTEERWATFTLDQQILMIANEMNRASALDRLRGFESSAKLLRARASPDRPEVSRQIPFLAGAAR